MAARFDGNNQQCPCDDSGSAESLKKAVFRGDCVVEIRLIDFLDVNMFFRFMTLITNGTCWMTILDWPALVDFLATIIFLCYLILMASDTIGGGRAGLADINRSSYSLLFFYTF
ncbi:MAG: hypothetical protein AABZ60_22070 [Planctomycetota bacterium]